MKGIILAAGEGTRLYPATFPISKILLPVYDRPMVYYPLSLLMLAGIREILVITNEKDSANFKRTLGDGSQFGIKVEYAIQHVQRGIADAFIIAEDWIGDDDVSLVLGDNILYGKKVGMILEEASKMKDGAMIFGIQVPDPKRFGVVEFDKENRVISLEEKPANPKSDYAAIGIYFYDNKAPAIAKALEPSSRGELEITDLNRIYLNERRLSASILDEDTKWIDAGTFDSLLAASLFIAEQERKEGRKILCPELIALKKGFVSKDKLIEWIDSMNDNEYFQSIRREI